MDWFVYDNGIRHERVKRLPEITLSPKRTPNCGANQWTGFYMITASVLKGLKNKLYPT